MEGGGGVRSFLIALLLTNSTLREYHVGNEQGETKTTRTFEYRDPERKEKKKKNKKKNRESSYRLLI